MLEDINRALDQLSSGKALGNDGIPVEVIKCAKQTFLKELHEILYQCWREGEVPQDMRDANIVTLYKNKGDRGDYNNYRGISLLNIVGKLFAKVVLIKLTLLADCANWYQMYLVSFPLEHTSSSFGTYQQCQKEDPNAWATQVLHIICPDLHPGEDTPASPHGVDTTREAAVTGYKPYC